MTTLILDGIWGWHTRWEGLRRKVEHEVGACRIWRYNNTGAVSLEKLGAQLAEELTRLGPNFHLIGYSMGGIVIREAMRQAPELPLDKTVLLHVPHGGTLTAQFLPLPACREMRPDSAFMRRLNGSAWERPTLASWSPGDLVVVPGWSARWDKASHHLRSDVPAHAWPIYSDGIHKRIIRFLSQGH